MNFLAPVIVGIATGVFSSFAVWWFLTRRLVPKLTICPTLGVFPSGRGTMMTQFRIVNPGPRVAHDLNVAVSIHMPSLIREGVIETLAVETHFKPVLEPGSNPRWPIRLRRSEELVGNYLKWLPDEIRSTFEETGRIPADLLLQALPGSSIYVSVSATDGYSRTRDHLGRAFTADDLVYARFIENSCGHVGVDSRSEPVQGGQSGRVGSRDQSGIDGPLEG